MTPQDKQAISSSLAALAEARQAELTAATLRAYLAVLDGLWPRDVSAACLELARLSRPDYAPAMPDAGTIREHARDAAKRRHEAQRPKMLPEGRPITPEQLADIRSRVAAALKRRSL